LRICVVDSDLLVSSTQNRLPNLVCMKFSTYFKRQGHHVVLAEGYDRERLLSFDKIYLSKVFTVTEVPEWVLELPNLEYGGTGFFFEKAPFLPEEIEHSMPDYKLYDDFILHSLRRGIKQIALKYYLDYSVGFMTRGCFRRCPFCVNKRYRRVHKASPIEEFFNPARRFICLLDDNVLGYKDWGDVLEQLKRTKRKFQFNQGLDMRIMTDDKAKALSSASYDGHFTFALDDINDTELVERKLQIWRKYHKQEVKFYVLCAYKSTDVMDIISIFERIFLLAKYKAIPYLMRYVDFKDSEMYGMYVALAAWINQPHIFEKMSFRQMFMRDAERNGGKSSVMRYALGFEKQYPTIARKYYDLRYEDVLTTGRFDFSYGIVRRPLLRRIPITTLE